LSCGGGLANGQRDFKQVRLRIKRAEAIADGKAHDTTPDWKGKWGILAPCPVWRRQGGRLIFIKMGKGNDNIIAVGKKGFSA
jgi:hypothetical protein